MKLPFIDLQPRVPIELSDRYSTPEYRLKTNEYDLVSWSGKGRSRCYECEALFGHEQSILHRSTYMRAIKERSVRLYVCSAHRRMWRERDWLDGTHATWCDHVFVERAINNYRYQRTDPLARELTECEKLTIVIWMQSNGFKAIDILRVMGEDEHNWNLYRRYKNLANEYA